jgi:membrane protease subunit (stomatin/prohibitin family)
MTGFMGMNMGSQSSGGFMDAASRTNQSQMQQQAQKVQEASMEEWKCSCGYLNDKGKFCMQCGTARAKDQELWKCECGETNNGNFCSACGKKRPEEIAYRCDKCGYEPPQQGNIPKFCPECGDPFNEADKK